MDNLFKPTHSLSSCCLAPTLPTRKRSNDMATMMRSSSVPTQLAAPTLPTRKRSNDMATLIRASSVPTQVTVPHSKSAAVSQQNASFDSNHKESLRYLPKNNDKFPPTSTLHSSSCMTHDQISRQRNVDAKSIAITRAKSCDLLPSLPVRSVSPIKEDKHSRYSKSWTYGSNLNRDLPLLVTEEESESGSESHLILKPKVKSNMFFQGVSFSRSKQMKTRSDNVLSTLTKRTRPTILMKALQKRKSPFNIMDAAQLGASEMNDSDYLQSRWSSSSSLTSVRHHESLSSSLEFFLDETASRQDGLGGSKMHNSTGSLRAPKERGLNRSNSSLHLEDIMFVR